MKIRTRNFIIHIYHHVLLRWFKWIRWIGQDMMENKGLLQNFCWSLSPHIFKLKISFQFHSHCTLWCFFFPTRHLKYQYSIRCSCISISLMCWNCLVFSFLNYTVSSSSSTFNSPFSLHLSFHLSLVFYMSTT